MKIGIAALLLGFLLLIGGCRPNVPPVASEGEPDAQQVPETMALRAVIDEDLPSLDPHHQLTVASTLVLRNVFEALVETDRERNLVPRLAERWETSDSQTWQFFLRPDVRFHDGTPMTSADVISSLERARNNPRSKVAGFLAGVESISEDPPSLSIQIITTRPDPLFLDSLVNVLIVPKGAPDEILKPVGTGPYQFVSYQPGHSLRLEAFDGYWRGAPSEAAVEFSIIPAADEAVSLLEKGEIDLVRNLPPALVDRVESKPDLWVESRLSQSTLYLSLNQRVAPMNDPRVRRAIDLALDREELMRETLLNHARPASQMVAPEVFGHDPSLAATRRDLEGARRLLREAGFGEGLELRMDTTEGLLYQAEAIGRQLDEAGFRTKVESSPWPELYAKLDAGEIGLWYGVWVFDSSDAGLFFDVTVHSPLADGSLGSSTFAPYDDPELDRMIRAVSAELDLPTREAKLREISRRIAGHRIQLPILWPLDLYGMHRDLDWDARKDGFLFFFDMKRKS